MTTLILASSLTGLSAFVEQVSKVDNMVGENLVVSLEGVESKEVSILDEEEDSLVCPIGEQMGVESKSLGDSESMLSIPLSCSTEARKETFSLHETVQSLLKSSRSNQLPGNVACFGFKVGSAANNEESIGELLAT